jgi:hypothetical protein
LLSGASTVRRYSPLGLVIATAILLAFSMPLAAAGPALSQPEIQAICNVVDRAAAANRLQPGFLARLLWLESRFRADATSVAGAIGIAQFMPLTAAHRGLADPRQPGPAVAEAARMLAELTSRFGNIGLAAAAYNAGAGRVAQWLRGANELAAETRNYVRIVTGRDVDTWAAARFLAAQLSLWDRSGCLDIVTSITASPPLPSEQPEWHFALDRNLAKAFGRLASLKALESEEAPSFAAARALCKELRAAGAQCILYAP